MCRPVNLSHPSPARPHDGDDNEEYDENAHQQDAVGGAGDGFALLEQARQGESAFRNGEPAKGDVLSKSKDQNGSEGELH